MGGGYILVWHGTNHSKKSMYFRACFVPDEARFVLLAKSPIWCDNLVKQCLICGAAQFGIGCTVKCAQVFPAGSAPSMSGDHWLGGYTRDPFQLAPKHMFRHGFVSSPKYDLFLCKIWCSAAEAESDTYSTPPNHLVIYAVFRIRSQYFCN